MDDKNEKVIGKKRLIFLMVYKIVMSLVLVSAIIITWSSDFTEKNREIYSYIQISFEQKMFLLTFLMGAMGSLIHAILSISKRTGEKDFDVSWFWWYLMKPFVGGLMGLMFYFVIRGGILAGSISAENINIYGICGIAGLAGLFSEQANKKLKEVFDTIFRVEEKKDKENTEKK